MIGKIEVITGPMFSGKTTELMRRLERHVMAGRSISYYVPEADTRTDSFVSIATTRKELKIPVRRITNDNITLSMTDVIAIDEAQFITDIKMTNYLLSLRNLDTIIIICGLDMDYLMRPFGRMGEYMAISDTVTKLTAVCKCGQEAQFTQRKKEGASLIEIGDSNYVARCLECYNAAGDILDNFHTFINNDTQTLCDVCGATVVDINNQTVRACSVCDSCEVTVCDEHIANNHCPVCGNVFTIDAVAM